MNNVIKSRSTKPGAVSMITVILMSIVLLVLVIGLAQIMINEQQQSSDNELTNRAFYAAEAGLESARQYISDLSQSEVENIASKELAEASCLNSSGNLQGDLPRDLTADSNFEAEVVCQKVAGVDGVYVVGDEIGVNLPRQYDLGVSKDSLLIEWATKGIASENFRSNGSLPTISSWGAPAAIRLELFSFQAGVPRSRLINLTREFYIIPTNSAIGSSTHSFSNIDEPVLASCDANVQVEQKMCSVTITNLPNRSYINQYARISYLYQTDTTFLTPLDSSGNLDDNLTSQLKVDTTGRAGDVYRRVQAQVDVANFDLSDSLPSYTVLGNQICKAFKITDDQSEFRVINSNPTTTSDYCSAN